jgi:integrase
MSLKKQHFREDETPIFDDAIIYRRGEQWQFRMWLEKEHKYVRKSLRTKNKITALERGKNYYLELHANIQQGKTYFSITTKEAVDMYIKYREKDLKAGLIVEGRLGTIKTHLDHWLGFIKKDTKIRDLARTDCEGYYHHRTNKDKKKKVGSPTTILNEQSTINAMMKYLHRQNEVYIDSFDFKKLPRIDRGDEDIRRACFRPDEIGSVEYALLEQAANANKDLKNEENLKQFVACYYFLIAMKTGLRTGEQKQLKWSDISWTEHKDANNEVPLLKIRVRAVTSKVRKTRSFMVRDNGYLDDYRKEQWQIIRDYEKKNSLEEMNFGEALVFSTDGRTQIDDRVIKQYFTKTLKLAEIDTANRDLVPYSFRHFFITNRIMSGLSYRQISDMCGTSATQIENTYYHINEEIMRTNAMAGYKLSEGGLIEAHEHFKD